MRLYFLDLGTLDMDRRVIMPASPPGERIRLPVPGYLIQPGDGSTILVDTGMGRDVLAGEVDFGGRMHPVDSAGAYVVDRLAALGLSPEDITTVVATHFHFDHAGGLADFPGATIVAQRAAVDAAQGGGRWGRSAVEIPGLRWRLVEGDTDLAPGVRLLGTTGHAVGHQSLLVTTARDGAFLLTIDAIYNRDQLAADDWGAYADQEAARASARKVQEIAREAGATLVYGHDAAQWATLRHAPEYYE
ncbi:MAG TPA: N-acyl homoserine lactonase family protein [Thermomicrobiales bacterium]|nr:N-acyl homoserine lactonase family protein [Thermomicrobiales bacterium]